MSLDTLVEALSAWAWPRMTPGELVALVKAHGLDLHLGYRERRPPPVVPGQVEAFPDLPVIYCVRCGRHLRHPQYLNGAPFGRVCAFKEGIGE